MNREESKSKIIEHQWVGVARNAIDEIYDDFESREKKLQNNIEAARVKIMSNIALTNDFDKKKAYKIINDMFKYIKDNK